MTPEEFVRYIDFRYITNIITPEEAITILNKEKGGKAKRMAEAERNLAIPAYITNAK